MTRIVSLVPSWTETLFDLGAGERLVGCSRYCVEPEALLRTVPRVGGTKNPDLEKISALRPDLVLCNGEENRQEHIAWLKERFSVFEATPKTVPEAARVVRELAQRTGTMDAAEAIVLEIEAQTTRAQIELLERRRPRVFYAIWKKPWMSINADTYVHDLLTRAGAINVTAGCEARYPALAPEELRGLEIELVILPSEPFVFHETHRREVQEQQVFGPEVPVVLADGKHFCWHGSRTGRGLGAAIDLLRRRR